MTERSKPTRQTEREEPTEGQKEIKTKGLNKHTERNDRKRQTNKQKG